MREFQINNNKHINQTSINLVISLVDLIHVELYVGGPNEGIPHCGGEVDAREKGERVGEGVGWGSGVACALF